MRILSLQMLIWLSLFLIGVATSPTVFAEPVAIRGIGPVGPIVELHTGFGFTEGPAADGKALGVITFPQVPANVTFGGAEGKTLFVTARKSLYTLKMSAQGHAFAGANKR